MRLAVYEATGRTGEHIVEKAPMTFKQYLSSTPSRKMLVVPRDLSTRTFNSLAGGKFFIAAV